MGNSLAGIGMVICQISDGREWKILSHRYMDFQTDYIGIYKLYIYMTLGNIMFFCCMLLAIHLPTHNIVRDFGRFCKHNGIARCTVCDP